MRTIDADALKETKYVYHDNGEVGERLYISFDEIDNAPTVDAVPVVRCKDCKHYKNGLCFFTMRRHGLHDDWYCADGERRANQ